MRYAERMGRLASSASFDMLARGKALEAKGRSIIHLGIGEPDFATPSNICRAAELALAEGHTHYGPPAGLPGFRALIAKTWKAKRGLACEAEHVVVTPGAKPVLFFAMLATLEPGDEVLIPSPAFPTYASVAEFLGARVVPVPLVPERGFDIDLEALRARVTSRSRMLVLNSPHNPTGGVLPPATLQAVAELALRNDLWVLSDEIYAAMTYDGECPSIATLPGMAERTVVVDGFSKTYAMTGWRLGFGIMPEPLAKHMTALMNNSNSCTATFVQMAGEAALTGPQNEVEAMLAEFRARREVVVSWLNSIPGVTCTQPAGAFYAFPRIDCGGLSSVQIADQLLQQAGVVTIPGTGFGAEGEGHVRLSYANSRTNLREGLKRMAEHLAPLARRMS